jgi:hypothetical protein
LNIFIEAMIRSFSADASSDAKFILAAVDRIRTAAGMWRSGKGLPVSDASFDFFQERIIVHEK